MSFVLGDDQQLLARTARDFIAERSPIGRARKLRDDRDPLGYSPKLYQEMAELGWHAIPFSEADGGLGMGLASMVLVTEAMGRSLAPEPILTSVMLAGQAIALGGSAAQRAAWLPAIQDGSKVLALAFQEASSRYDLNKVQLRAERTNGGYTLSGEKVQVLDGQGAQAFVVSARTSGPDGSAAGVSLFLVEATANGLQTRRQSRVDSRNACLLTLDAVRVGEDALLGKLDGGADVLSRTIERASVALCGEMLGGMSEAFEQTVEYLKQRKQFDTLIGTFQALQHRAARMFVEIELARSAVMAAARALDAGVPEASSLVCVAKARCSEAYTLIANEAVQMFGGIGMTDEHDIGFYMKRARVAELTFGDAAYHRDRWAQLGEY
jgi:alkylation response protein AidB-like acyl-CoA dehydrogenase